ncbi:MAG: hypothetical protein JNG90_03275 [Planctomycetaceae bacterium]|nr:hypothetical protein [Planctomycetaceae bacterium]
MTMELMEQGTAAPFVDRRQYRSGDAYSGREHRQFSDSYNGLTPEARQLAEAVDGYKLRHRRRFISYEELLDVVRSLGYHQ